ncbi:MAG: hypothetical protein Q7U04_07020 [Bacteriovorax sp.]|nr:hypothetical protein [Bacteriovorax sp.]
MNKEISKYLILICTILMGTPSFATESCDDSGICLNLYEARDAQSCSDQNTDMAYWFQNNLSSTVAPIELRLGPIRDQERVGWCFAHTAADLMSEEAGVYLSAAQIAKNYFLKSKIAWLWGGKESGTIDDAIDLSLKSPLCDEVSFPSIGLTPESAKNISCLNPVVVMSNYKTSRATAKGSRAGASLFPLLDKTLQNGKIVGIEYNANKLIYREQSNIRNAWPDHTSSIVSRYFDFTQNKCRYIIRNTWGKDCSKKISSKVICKQGYYSVSEEDLNDSLNTVVILNEKN